jgi:hypothetical protein
VLLRLRRQLRDKARQKVWRVIAARRPTDWVVKRSGQFKFRMLKDCFDGSWN